MAIFFYLLLITKIILSTAEPIDEGIDVGTIQVDDGKKIVQNPGEHPYIVHLTIDSYEVTYDPFRIKADTWSCVGVLLKRDIVLSAAHCIGDVIKRPKITAWLGILDTELQKGKGQQIPVKGLTVHHNYIESKENLYVNDITLMWLKEPAKLYENLVELAKLPTANFHAAGKPGWILGWGCLFCGKVPTMLQKAAVRGVSWTKCQNYYKKIKIMATNICIMDDNKQATSTTGDSGGPFVVEGKVVGLCSFGAIDWWQSDVAKEIIVSDAKKPAAYTYIPKYLDWIQRTSEEEPQVKLGPIIGPLPTKSTTRTPPKGPPSKIQKKTTT